MRTSYEAVTLFFASTQTDRAHAREKRKRCEEQRAGECLRQARQLFVWDGPFRFCGGHACFYRQKRGDEDAGTGRGVEKAMIHKCGGRGARGVLFRRGGAWRRAAKARRHFPARGELPCAGCAAASAPACPSPWLCRTLSTRRGFRQRGGDVHATLQSSGVLREGERRRLPEDGRGKVGSVRRESGPGRLRKTPAEA